MKRTRLVAKREFLAIVRARGFLFGLIVMPVLIFLSLTLLPRVLDGRVPQVRGEVAVIDRAGGVLVRLRATLDPATLAEQQAYVPQPASVNVPVAAARTAAAATGDALGRVPRLHLIERSTTEDLEASKRWLLEKVPGEQRLALVVIHGDAVVPADAESQYGTYDLYVSSALTREARNVLANGLRDAIAGARLERSGLKQSLVEAMTSVPRPNSIVVTAVGEQRLRPGFNRLLPLVFGVLIFMGVMIGGQTLMTSTIEEKSSRVIEVLLAAVSPLELMAGKLLGQLGAGLIIMVVYGGLGLWVLFSFTMLGLLDPMLVVWLLVFFLVAHLFFGALMLAIGASVNQVNEAQALMGPVLVLLVGPYLLMPMIGQAPNSTFSVAMSFVPPVNAFVMIARLASDTPPPLWQVVVALLLCAAAACVAILFTAKIFKIGLLMHGKPPSFKTLLRWVRAA